MLVLIRTTPAYDTHRRDSKGKPIQRPARKVIVREGQGSDGEKTVRALYDYARRTYPGFEWQIEERPDRAIPTAPAASRTPAARRPAPTTRPAQPAQPAPQAGPVMPLISGKRPPPALPATVAPNILGGAVCPTCAHAFIPPNARDPRPECPQCGSQFTRTSLPAAG
jgi:hypothetical protein